MDSSANHMCIAYCRNNQQANKKARVNDDLQLDESNDKTLFTLLQLPAKVVEKPPQHVDTEKLSTFSNLLQKFTAEHSVETVSQFVHPQFIVTST